MPTQANKVNMMWLMFQIARVATFSTNEVSYIANPLESIGRNFDLTFKMKTKQKKALLVFASNDDQVMTQIHGYMLV